jgi:hypothetical protein
MAMRFDLPQPDPETERWWEAANEDRLLMGHCPACGRHHFYPRPFCPRCHEADVEWVEASGEATLYTWSVVHRNDLPPWPDRVPYVAAVVELAEGPKMMTRLVDCEPEQLEVGMPLALTFVDHTDEQRLPVFRPR